MSNNTCLVFLNRKIVYLLKVLFCNQMDDLIVVVLFCFFTADWTKCDRTFESVNTKLTWVGYSKSRSVLKSAGKNKVRRWWWEKRKKEHCNESNWQIHVGQNHMCSNPACQNGCRCCVLRVIVVIIKHTFKVMSSWSLFLHIITWMWSPELTCFSWDEKRENKQSIIVIDQTNMLIYLN